MKKIISLLLGFAFLVVGFIGATLINAESIDSLSDSVFKYAITPDSPEWKNFETAELKSMLNITTEEAENMDTDTLLKAVLDYPFLGDIYAFENPSDAVNIIAEQFNGLAVLLQRSDLKDKLLCNYINASDKILNDCLVVNTEERYRQKYMESLLSHPAAFTKLSQAEKASVISSSLEVSKKIDSYPITSETSTFGLESAISPLEVDSSMSPSGLEPVATPFGFMSSGIVLTPMRSSVPVIEMDEMSNEEKVSADAYMTSRYPNAVKLRTASNKYNCHSYAWYNTSAANTWWMNDPKLYMTDGSYTRLSTKYPTASGQKIYYPTPGNEHSGIVTTASTNFNSVQVTSKWGFYGLYKHGAADCPYYSSSYPCSFWSKQEKPLRSVLVHIKKSPLSSLPT
jgi:hypothetical protein